MEKEDEYLVGGNKSQGYDKNTKETVMISVALEVVTVLGNKEKDNHGKGAEMKIQENIISKVWRRREMVLSLNTSLLEP